MMDLLRRDILGRNFFLRPDCVHHVPEAVRRYHSKRFREAYEAVKRLDYNDGIVTQGSAPRLSSARARDASTTSSSASRASASPPWGTRGSATRPGGPQPPSAGTEGQRRFRQCGLSGDRAAASSRERETKLFGRRIARVVRRRRPHVLPQPQDASSCDSSSSSAWTSTRSRSLRPMR